ncbi:16S rRNA (adenine(1518)-N(6)/adenine(1519)-N(6))-dimethyltransferase RsmA [Clostridium sp. D2Q-14]|uniref:16S rRNA (adenine(1518)-N(6)/adenine(1519)-N(6))- dimethyltransferase RsmA n=1 Tax=Anaeromonas gelatinilytica TaxID=2683194 RepID=UPI00193AF737|nr:16S rRNA (adenine(1518)-N(6)/adenine(1519)-N(6))-dimethyltransferase RsmA [Anaeromonas gelatinilytica]MBS4535160.1 16S rRNA (adenine(1518)-N(6)/adenine(1519)-N(6))-dimethyltransferase RsmA [Anaeromonas gelatinilytica]
MSNNYRLYSPKVMRDILHKYGFRFSKGLGQNFLIDGNILDKICDGIELSKNDEVIEIGPGIGTLTQALAERAKKIMAIEIDKKLIPILEDTLSNYDNIEVINGDVLKLDLNELIEDKFENKKIKLAANLPYYITTPIIMKLLEDNINLESIIVMVQKEVAERIQALPGTKDYGALSIAVQYYSNPEIVTIVPKNVFMPKPNVDSAVIRLNVYDEPKVKVKDEKLFFKVVKGAFALRRKTLLNSLGSFGIGVGKEEIREILKILNIKENIRGEKLSIEEIAKISDMIYELNKK